MKKRTNILQTTPPATNFNFLDYAIRLATNGHFGQTRPNGETSIMHPIRVMMKMKTTEEKTVAILHDLIEDTIFTLKTLEAAGFSQKIITAVDCLTHRANEIYPQYIDRIILNKLATAVKLGDLEDDMTQLPVVGEKELIRNEKYKTAFEKLKDLK